MRANAKNVTVEAGTKFAKALVSEEYAEARLYLTHKAQKEYPLENLARTYQHMVSYWEGPVQVDGHFEFMAEWPAHQPEDIGWAYISISGSDFAEAFTVIGTDENGFPKIRDIEWGRP